MNAPNSYIRPCPECGAQAGEPCWDLRSVVGARRKIYAHPQRQQPKAKP